MTKKLYISSIFLIFSFNLAFACTCGSNKSFLRTISNAKVIALIKVNHFLNYDRIQDQDTPLSMEVEIIEIYKGELISQKIEVWGDNGVLCRPYLDTVFEEGKYYIIGLYSALDGRKGYVHKDERTEDFAISSCGYYWLNVDLNDKMVYGIINSNKREMKFEKLMKKLKRKIRRH